MVLVPQVDARVTGKIGNSHQDATIRRQIDIAKRPGRARCLGKADVAANDA